MTITKVCNTCGLEKSLEHFHKWVHGPDGLRTSCKPCINKSQAKRDEVKKWKKRFAKTTEDKMQARRERALEGF